MSKIQTQKKAAPVSKTKAKPATAGSFIPQRQDPGDVPIHRIPRTRFNPAILSLVMDRIEEVRNGVPYAEFQEFISNVGLTVKDASTILDLPERTMARRKDGRLEPKESDRFFRLVRIWDRAVEVLGTEEKARSWFQAPNRSLGEIPFHLLDTDIGSQAVEAVLGRIEYGVFS